MRDHHHRHAFFGQVQHDIQHFFDHLRVQGAGGFIEKHDLGIHGQGAGNGHPLLLAAGKLTGIGIELFRSMPTLSRRAEGDLPGFFSIAFAHHFLGQGEIVHDRQMRKEVERLENHAHFAPDGVDVLGAFQVECRPPRFCRNYRLPDG